MLANKIVLFPFMFENKTLDIFKSKVENFKFILQVHLLHLWYEILTMDSELSVLNNLTFESEHFSWFVKFDF